MRLANAISPPKGRIGVHFSRFDFRGRRCAAFSMLRRFLLRLCFAFTLLVFAWGARKWWRHRGYHPYVAPLQNAPFFADDFDGAPLNPINRAHLDPLKWQVQGDDQILQRTQWGLSPSVLKDADGTGFVRLCLDTFNPKPEKAGRFYLSTQMTSLDRWKLGEGLEFEARLRMDHLPPGLILGFFAYGDAGVWRKTYQKTEADFEFLTHRGGRQVWTHLWDNWNPLREGQNDGSLWMTGSTNWNQGDWNTFKIRWYPDRTEWICNDYLLRAETRVRPGSPMGVWFNLWAPNPDWGDAYDPAIQPARSAARNRRYFYDVDYVRVRRIPAAPRDNSNREIAAPTGEGDGLKAEYFPSPDLSGPQVVRLDSRVDFDWGVHPPDSQLPRDGFSARWTGFIEARRSEPYTFTVQSREGARLWVNGRLLIDDWEAPQLVGAPVKIETVSTGTSKPPTPSIARSATIGLRAGERVPIRLEISNREGAARVQLRWHSASTPDEIVPQNQLYPRNRPAPPHFSPGSCALSGPQLIAIQSATPGATIRYTLDGKPPTRLSRKLPNGGEIRVGYTTLLRADATLPGEVPSEVARAYYVLNDITAPQIGLDAPVGSLAKSASGGAWRRIGGAVFDGGSGVSRVDLVITRGRDGLKWKNGVWVREEWGIGAKIAGGKWSVGAGLPALKDLAAGQYELKAVAYDGAGNIKAARLVVTVVGSSRA